MNTFFQFIMYHIFGRAWILYDMRQGLKMAIFVNEAEIAMQRAKIRTAQDTLAKLNGELSTLESRDPLEGLEQSEDKKAYYDAKKVREEGHKKAIEDLKGLILGQENIISGTDGELQRIYAIAYSNRVKYDFVKTYKPKRSYSDGGSERRV